MYVEHFGMREPPFRITPHTEFFFSGGNRGATLDALVYAVTHDEGIVKVTGEVGSGKTMLCRMLLEKLPSHVGTIYLANPSMTRDEILFALAGELELDEPPAKIHLLLRTIQQRLVELYGQGRQIVMLIDEAHAMPAESLEEIRLLSNLESNRHKLLQIVLFGQPELDELLARNEMRQLRERVTHNFSLEPLHRQDIGSYINFRMRAAGYHGPDPFTPSAIQLISASSMGLTRRINILADKALLAAFSENLYQVDRSQAKAAIRDAQFGPMPGLASRDRPARTKMIGAGLGIALLAAGAGWYAAGRTPVDATPLAIRPAEKSPGPATPVAPPAAPVRPVAAEPPGSAVATPPATATPEPAARPDGPSPLAAEPGAGAARAVAAADPSDRRAEVRSRMQAFDEWLAKARDDHYFVQLLRARGGSLREVEEFIARNAKGLDRSQLRVYRLKAAGQEWVGVIYGEYASREESTQAIAMLPAAARAHGPYPRLVRNLR